MDAPSKKRCPWLLVEALFIFCGVFGPNVVAAHGSQAMTKPNVADQLLLRLPSDWRPIAQKFAVFRQSDKSLLNGTDEDIRAWALEILVLQPGASDFVIDQLGKPMPTEQLLEVLRAITRDDNWVINPKILTVLEHEALSEPNPKISMEAFKSLHILQSRQVQRFVETRLGQLSSEYEGNRQEVDQLEKEDERLTYIEDDVSLPEFLITAPPAFRASAKTSAIRVVAIGDFGTDAQGGRHQKRVAAAMVSYHAAKAFDFGITLGDNLYFNMSSPDDPAWTTAFENLYGPMDITFYPTFGNHDWGGDLPGVELLYSRKTRHWYFPSPYYTYSAGPAQFFAINTGVGTQPSAVQLRWLRRALDASTAAWKIVYAHYPIFTSCAACTDVTMYKKLMPILAGRADLYLSGHIHSLQHHQPEDGVNFFIIGASGQGHPKIAPPDPQTIFAHAGFGFGVLDVDDHSLTVRIIDEDGNLLHEATFRK